MSESKALDEQTKMARLLQFLEVAALGAVQRYEAVPGGLAKSLEFLQNRFGKPFKIVRERLGETGLLLNHIAVKY